MRKLSCLRPLLHDSEFEWWRDGSSGNGQWWGTSQAIPFLDNFDIREVLFDSSDRLLFAGTMTALGSESVARAFVARFESFSDGETGILDTSFSGAGWAYFDDAPYCDTEDCRLIDIEESRDATTKYIALLERVTGVVTADYFLVGLTATGALDANFGIAGLSCRLPSSLSPAGGAISWSIRRTGLTFISPFSIPKRAATSTPCWCASLRTATSTRRFPAVGSC